MTRKRTLPVYLVTTAALLLAAAFSAPQAEAQYCENYLGLILTSDDSCDAVPTTRRPIGVQSFWWGAKQMLMVNVGNEVRLYNLSSPASPQNPSLIAESTFKVVIHSDTDQNLVQFGVGDDARFIPAAFGPEGSGLADLGTGASPTFTADDYWYVGSAETNRGGFTFNHDGTNYVVGSNMPNGCPAGSAIYLATSITSSGLQQLYCLPYHVSRGWYMKQGSTGHLYIMDEWARVTAYSFIGSPSTLTNHGQFATPTGDEGFALDTDLELAIEVDTLGTTLWDLSNGANPAAYPLNGSFKGNVAAIRYPLAFVAASPLDTMGKLLDITDPMNIVEADPGFWSDPAATWNTNNCADDYAADFSMDGSVLYFARFSVLQKVDVTGCGGGGGALAPTANVAAAPSPAFPGDTITATNLSSGTITNSAVWITDNTGEVVAGSPTLSASSPSTANYDVPQDLAYGVGYTAWAAVENDENPLGCTWNINPNDCGNQLKWVAFTIDRAPEASIDMTPEAPITGDTLLLQGAGEGNEGGGELVPFEWDITPPLGAGCPTAYPDCIANTQSISVPLDVSGTWCFDLRVNYQHATVTGGAYSDTATTGNIDISSVAAAFTVNPPTPLNTQAITLTSTSSVADGVDPEYDWTITGPSSYTLCGAIATCNIPADTLSPGDYEISLEVTNPDPNNPDTDTETKTVPVGDGSVNPDFQIGALAPIWIGETVTFTVTGVDEVDQVVWNFGGPGCGDYTQNTTCVPGLFDDCLSATYQYASSGSKTVSMTITYSGSQLSPVTDSLTIASDGACSGGSCSYSLSPTTTSIGEDGGNRSVAVTTSSGCSWTGVSNTTWISVTSGSSGSGSGTVNFNVGANSGSSGRTGTLTIAGKMHAVNQAGTGGGSGGDLDFEFTAFNPGIGQSIPFTVTGISNIDSAEWNFGGPGCGSFTQTTTCTSGGVENCVNMVYQYSTSGAKTVTLSVVSDGTSYGPVSHGLTINDSGSCDGGSCSYTLSPASADFGPGGGTATVNLTTQTDCEWEASSNHPAWLHITGGWNGSSSGTITYSVDEKVGPNPRSGTLSIATKTFYVDQEGPDEDCEADAPTADFTMSPSNPGLDSTVTFTDTSTNEPESWQWLVRKGAAIVTVKTTPSFQWTFQEAGDYQVDLTVENCAGTDVETRSFTVSEVTAPIAFVVPAAAHAAGLNGTRWLTDLRIFNPLDEDLVVEMALVVCEGGSESISSVILTLDPKETRVVTDVVRYILPVTEDDLEGALRFTVQSPEGGRPIIMSRTYNVTDEGTFGQYIPAVPVILGESGTWVLTGLAQNEDFRTNIGVSNLGETAANGVQLVLLDAQGKASGTYTMDVPPMATVQVGASTAFGISDMDVFSVRVEPEGNDVAVYSSVVHSISGDPVLQLPGRGVDPVQLLPGVAHLYGLNDSSWRTDIGFFNPNSSTITVVLVYVPDPAEGWDRIFTKTLDLAPESSNMVRDVLAGWIVTEEGSSKGYLRIETPPDVQPPVVSGRTYTTEGDKVFGQGVVGVEEGTLTGAGETVYVPGVSNSTDPAFGFRTNLGLINANMGASAAVHLRLYDVDGNEAAVKTINLSASDFMQFNLFTGLELEDEDMDGSLEVTVSSGASVLVYASMVDNSTNDPILEIAQ